MGNPYTSVSATGYNTSPPPDDGTTGANNEITWAGIKSKLTDPLKTEIDTVNSNVQTALGKIFGNNVTAISTAYSVAIGDQGKLLSVTGANTITLPAAGTASSNFCIVIKNAGTNTVTVAGNGAELVDGVATISLLPKETAIVVCNGSAWTSTLLTSVDGTRFANVGNFGQCRLTFVNATSIKLSPRNGNAITIAGTVYSIPSAGITAANTNVFVNGTSGQNLAASTLYYVYLFNNSGTLTVDFSTTTHATDTAAGNVGVEIKSGDNTRSLVGMAKTNGSSQFQNDNTLTGVRSWFNRQPVSTFVSGSTGAGYGSNAADTAFGSGTTICMWADESYAAFEQGNWNGGTVAAGSVGFAIFVDSVSQGHDYTNNIPVSNLGLTLTASCAGSLSEGAHLFQPGLFTSGLGSVGSSTMYLNVLVK